MTVKLNKIKEIQKNNNLTLKSDVCVYNNVGMLNNLASENLDQFRLSPGAKRMLILKRLDTCQSDKDFVSLMRLLNEIDAEEDKRNGGIRDNNLTVAWSDSSDAEVISDNLT